VKKLEPGAYLLHVRGNRKLEPVRYWTCRSPANAARGSPDTWEADLRERLREAVRKRLVSDVRSARSSRRHRLERRRRDDARDRCREDPDLLDRLQEPQYDESQYARMVAEAKQTDHKAEVVEASDYSLLDQLVGIYDEPYADSSAIPTYRVCQLARRHVTVALSGDGGDEDFIGYRRYKLFAMEEAVRSRVPEGVRRAVFGPLGRWYPKLDWAPRFVRGKTTFRRSRAARWMPTCTACRSARRR